MRILIVDPSVLFRTWLRTAFEGHAKLQISASASSGDAALRKLGEPSKEGSSFSFDLVLIAIGPSGRSASNRTTRDGLATIAEIRRRNLPVRVIAMAPPSVQGGEAALEALANGADDVISKPEKGEMANESSRRQWVTRLETFQSQLRATIPVSTRSIEAHATRTGARPLEGFRPEVIVIGASTGGPSALERLLSSLDAAGDSFPPLVIAQHMPPHFTKSLAARLALITRLPAVEATHGEKLKPGVIYVAPGDLHLTIVRNTEKVSLRLDRSPPRHFVRPSVDKLFESAAEVFSDRCLGIVLTGMGRDGADGATAIRRAGGIILVQDEASCAVYGMPQAVVEVGAFDAIGSLSALNSWLREIVGSRGEIAKAARHGVGG